MSAAVCEIMLVANGNNSALTFFFYAGLFEVEE